MYLCIFKYYISEKAMAAHSSTLAWKITWVVEPGRLHAFHGAAKSWTQLSDFTFTFHFHALEKEMAPTPVFLQGESQGRGSLVGCCLWGLTELDMTEATQEQQHFSFFFLLLRLENFKCLTFKFAYPLFSLLRSAVDFLQ